MKNKKLFAILTLVCFMFTLMPVAAFAADPFAAPVVTQDADGDLTITGDATATTTYFKKANDTVWKAAGAPWALTSGTANVTADRLVSDYAALGDFELSLNADGSNAVAIDEAVVERAEAYVKATANAAVSGAVSASQSYAWTVDAGANIKAFAEREEVKVQVWNRNSANVPAANLYVWATVEGSDVPVESLNVYATEAATTALTNSNYIYTVPGPVLTGDSFWVSFLTTGTFELHVSAVAPTIDATSGKVTSLSNEFVMVGGKDKVSVYSDADDTKLYVIDTDIAGTVTKVDKTQVAGDTIADGETLSSLAIEANNVDEKEVTITLYKDATKAKVAAYKTIDIEVAGAIDTNVDKVTTDMLGQATFKVSGSRDGVYKIYLSTGKYESVIEVVVGAITANSIKAEGETAPYDILGETDFADVIEFTMYDVNGNKLDPAEDLLGWEKAANSTNDKYNYNGEVVDATGYVAIVEQPEASKLTNKDLYFDGETILIANGKTITAEGEYTFKVVLDNGAYATVSCVVKAFDKPVQLVINVANNIELGATVAVDTDWIDANGVVEEDTKGVEVVATGYAVKSFANNLLTAKSDEKYVGAVITLTAVDERYNLVATEEVTIANEAKELAFTAKTAAVNVNNYIDVNVVDADGKVVSLAGNEAAIGGKAEISYVILDKPEGANVFVSTYEDGDLLSDGVFTMNLTSNKVGNVAVQAVLKYEVVLANVYDNTNTNVVKYYTGSQIFSVGTEGRGDVVVMSVGSNEIVINDAKATIDAAPIVENNRTFVPFRALAEAFGATVAYDEATQAVTAELNGVTVVMTIGSATYTVNGVEKTADVAPFINGSRTMVPVRFAAEAFGIKVIPTYDENGATADILFNL